MRPDGIDLVYLNQPVEETFFRMLRYREFDACEMSLSSYVASLGRDDPAFIAIPAFPSRFFRHSCIFVSAKSGIGYLIWQSWQTLSVEEMYVGLITIGFLGFLSFALLDLIETWLIPWKAARLV